MNQIDEKTLRMLGFRKVESLDVEWRNEALHLGYIPGHHDEKQFWLNFVRNVVSVGQETDGSCVDIADIIVRTGQG